MPNMPRLEMEKPPPSNSCGFSFLVRARSASDFTSLEITASPLLFGAEDDGRDETEIERHGDADVGVLVAQDGGVGPARIDLRHAHQRQRATPSRRNR